MERNQDSEEGESWVQSPNITINGDANHHHHHDDDDERLCELKKEIASHSLYSLLVQSHFNCFKLCLGNMESVMINPAALANQHAGLVFKDDGSELDQFMEAYCMTLKKLEEAMEQPQQESMAFISLMYSQLDDLQLDNPSTRDRDRDRES